MGREGSQGGKKAEAKGTPNSAEKGREPIPKSPNPFPSSQPRLPTPPPPPCSSPSSSAAVQMFPQSSRLMTKRGRPLIRAILFIVRLRRDVQAQHRRRTTRKRMGGLANAAGRLRQAREQGGAVGGQREDRPGLIRCESSRRPQRELQRQQQHRNSAPSAVFLRSPTPQPMVGPDSVELAAVVDIGSEFESFVRMPQPYQLRLDKNGSQLGLHSSTAHQLAARAMFRRSRGLTGMGGSLDQQSATNGGGRTSSAELASRLLFHRQGSVETAASAGKCPSGVNGGGLAAADLPRRKLKAGMVGLIGALTALEQGDLEALGAVLSRNGSQQQQLEFRLDEPLEGGLYALFEPRLRLLDVALMLGRPRAVEMLMEHGAVDLFAEVPSVMQRRAAVEAALAQCEQKAREQHERPKEEEKRRLQLDAQLAILRRMRAHLSSRHSLPLAPSNVRATCTSPCAVCIQFEPTESSDDVDDDGGCMAIASSSSPIVRARVEWSRCSDFSSLEGTKEVRDIRSSKIVVSDLPLGEQFAFRVSLASIWGWGPPRQAEPNMLRISSWTELENTEQGRLDPKELADLVEEVERHRQGPVWQRIFPSCSSAERDRKRKTGLKHLFSASSKFVKNVQRGLFLATIFYTESRILCTVDDCLPVICVDESSQGLASDELHWLMKLSMCWEQLPMLQESLGSCASGSANCQLRARLLDAAVAMHNALGVRDIGRVHHIPVQPQPGTCLLVTVRLLESSSGEAQGLAMRWMRLEKLLRRRQACPALECLSRELLPLLNFFESSQICLQPGLYLAYLRLQSSLNSIHVLVPENLTSALPFAQIRQNSHVTREEWAHLQALARLDEKPSSGSPEEKKPPTDAQRKFHEELARAARMLVMDLELDPEQLLGTRLFRHRLVQLDEQVSLVLVMPRAEEVCQVNCPATTAAISTRESSGSIFALGSMAQFRGCISVPVPVFQMVNLCAYQPDFLSAYCALSVFIDHFQMVAQHEQRACLVENDARVYADQLEQLGLFQHRLKAIWRSARWISCFASVARERGGAHRNCSLRLTRLLRPADDQSPAAADFLSSNGGGRDRLANVLARRNGLVPSLSPLRPHSQQSGSCCSLSAGQSFSCGSSPAPSAKTSLVQSMAGCSLPGTPPADQQRAAQLDGQLQLLEASSPTEQQPPAQTSGVLRVFSAFDTGLAQKGVSVRLRVFADTKAAEVVQLVVRQVARIRLCGGGEELMPSAKASSPSSASNFPDPGQHCLVSVVGTRERRFTDEFPVLRMGQPWERGRLCVRHIRQIGAAIKLANETAV